MIRDNLVKDVHKFNGLPDWDIALHAVWAEDKDRHSIYSREKVLQDWNRHVVEHRA